MAERQCAEPGAPGHSAKPCQVASDPNRIGAKEPTLSRVLPKNGCPVMTTICRNYARGIGQSATKLISGPTMPELYQRSPQADTTFEVHYSVADLAKQWRLGRETVRLLVKDEPGVLKIRLGIRKTMTRYSVPESVARRVHTRLFDPLP